MFANIILFTINLTLSFGPISSVVFAVCSKITHAKMYTIILQQIDAVCLKIINLLHLKKKKNEINFKKVQ